MVLAYCFAELGAAGREGCGPFSTRSVGAQPPNHVQAEGQAREEEHQENPLLNSGNFARLLLRSPIALLRLPKPKKRLIPQLNGLGSEFRVYRMLLEGAGDLVSRS